MILLRVRVEGFRCFRNPVELGGLSTGIHVIHAPNESGKSTLVLAVARALFDRYNTRGDDARAEMRPWGTKLSPRIELELESGGRRFRLKKSFLDGASSLLDEWRPGGFERLAEAAEADDLVRGMAFGEPSKRGLTDLADWGLARLLWLPQSAGRLSMPGVSGSLQQRLLGVVGATSLDGRERELTERLERAYQEHFQPAKGKARTGSPAAQAAASAASAEEEAARWREACEQAAGLDERVAESEASLAQLEQQLRDHQRELEIAERAAAEEATLLHQLELQEANARAARGQCEQLKRQLELAAETAQSIAARRAEAAAFEPGLTAAVESVARTTQALEEAERHRSTEREVFERTERLLERARALERFRALETGLRQMVAKLEQLRRLAADLGRIEQMMSQQPAPGPEEVERGAALQRKIDQAEAKLENLGVEVLLSPEAELGTVAWETTEGVRKVQVQAGRTELFRSAAGGSLAIPGVGRLSIRSGSLDAAKLLEKRDGERAELARLLGEWRAADLDALRQLHAAARQRELELAGAKESLAESLGGEFESVFEAEAALRKMEGELQEQRIQLGEDADSDLPPAGSPALAEELRAARRRLDEAVGLREQASRALAQARRQQQRLEAERARCLETAAALEAEQATRERRLGTVVEMETAFQQRSGELALAQGAAAAFARRLPAPEKRAAAIQARLAASLESVRKEERRLRDDAARARALLDQAAAAGAYSRRVQAEEKLTLAREEQARLERRAEAVRLLRGLAAGRQEKVTRSVVAPVQQELQARLEFIRSGARGPLPLVLEPDLSGAALQAGEDSSASISALSWGTQEQLMLALRLTLGALLAGHEPQMVVLDDPLVNTDAPRAARALELLQGAAAQLQVIVLTAFPERYRGLQATCHDLRALVETAQE